MLIRVVHRITDSTKPNDDKKAVVTAANVRHE
jgi:hypothetical protein